MNSSAPFATTARVIVVGNDKGGCGKSTLAMNVAVALLVAGQRVATIDLDTAQKTLTHFIRNRRRWADMKALYLPTPDHHTLEPSIEPSERMGALADYDAFTRLKAHLEDQFDFIIIDTGDAASNLSRLAHSQADLVITPVSDRFADMDTLAQVSDHALRVEGLSAYAQMVQEGRTERGTMNASPPRWVVVRNRLSPQSSPETRAISDVLGRLSETLEFESTAGLSEQSIYRDYFSKGLTVLDPLSFLHPAHRSTVSHMAGRQELMDFVSALDLPLSQRAQRRRSSHEIWRQTAALPLELMEVLA